MAGKITELAALTGAGAATGDLIETVDVSDTSMASSGTNKKMALSDLVTFVAANGAAPTGTKLSALAALTGAAAATGDILEVVDISDTTMASSGTNKKITLAELLIWVLANGGIPPLRRVLNAQTGTSYTPVVSDENKMVTLGSGSATTVTLPSDATAAFPIGAEVDFLWIGTGAVSFNTSGSTINSEANMLKMRARYTACTAKKIAANTWALLGALTP